MGQLLLLLLLFFLCLGALVHFFNHTELGKGLKAISGPFIWFIGLILGGILGLFGLEFDPPKGRYGSGKEMSWWDQLGFISRKNTGTCIQGTKHISLDDSTRHTVIKAGSGSGKTMINIVPTVLAQKGKSSLVITDPSGEIRKLCEPWLISQGFDTRAIDIKTPSNTITYNSFARIRDSQDILRICDILTNSGGEKTSSKNDFWEKSSKDWMYLHIRCLQYEPPQYRNLPNLRKLATNFGINGEGLDEFYKRTAVYDEKLFAEVMAFRRNSPEVLQNILASCRAYLSDYIDETICNLTATDTIGFEDMRKKPVAIFINVSEEKQSVYSGLLAMLFSQMMDFANIMPVEGEPYLPIMFLLDEFTNIGVIPEFADRISYLRKKDISIVLCIQSGAALESKYGERNARAILANCSSTIVHGGQPIQECELLSRTLDVQDFAYTETAEESTGDTQRRVVISRRLRTPGELRTMEGILYLFAHKPPIMFNKKIPWYKNRKLIKKTELPNPNPYYGSATEVEYLRLESEENTDLEYGLIEHFTNDKTPESDAIEPAKYPTKNEQINM